MLVRFKVNATGEIVERVYHSYQQFLDFKRKAEHSKKITLISWWKIDE